MVVVLDVPCERLGTVLAVFRSEYHAVYGIDRRGLYYPL